MVMFETKKEKNRKGKGKRLYSSSNSDSSSNEEEPWRSGMNGAEQMHMLAYAGINPNTSDIEFDSDDKKCYQNQSRK